MKTILYAKPIMNQLTYIYTLFIISFISILSLISGEIEKTKLCILPLEIQPLIIPNICDMKYYMKEEQHYTKTFGEILSVKGSSSREKIAIRNEIFFLAFELLRYGITLRYKAYPYVALCIYKKCHKNKNHFEAIASAIISNQEWVIPLLGNTLLKVLGPVTLKATKKYKLVKRFIVSDFKEILYRKSSYFLFPTIQIASEDTLSYKDFQQKYSGRNVSDMRCKWKNSQQICMFKPFKGCRNSQSKFKNPVIVIKSELPCVYKSKTAGTLHIIDFDIAIRAYFSVKNKAFLIQQDTFVSEEEDSILNINFKALYCIPELTETDILIQSLLYRYVKKISDRSPQFYSMLYQKAKSETTRSTIATVYTHDQNNHRTSWSLLSSYITVLWKMLLSFIAKLSPYAKKNIPSTGNIPNISLVQRVFIHKNKQYIECPKFWSLHNRSVQKEKRDYAKIMCGSRLETCFLETENVLAEDIALAKSLNNQNAQY